MYRHEVLREPERFSAKDSTSDLSGAAVSEGLEYFARRYYTAVERHDVILSSYKH